ncbi:MAG: glutaredoxin family protein [Anaerolineae bacterium]|nr:glutaredoxin family protein [Anaerolineae bacterium]
MPLPITIFGASDCDDTAHVRAQFTALGIPFREVNIEHDPDAERFVIFVNSGFRSTPTLVIGEGKLKTILTEPSDSQLAEMLSQAGYPVPAQTTSTQSERIPNKRSACATTAPRRTRRTR